MAWIFLIIAGLFEVVWAYFMKQSDDFTRLVPTLITFVTMFISFGLLSILMKTLPLGTAYGMWTGIGALGAFLVGNFFMDEPANAMRVGAAALIVAGLALMKIATPA